MRTALIIIFLFIFLILAGVLIYNFVFQGQEARGSFWKSSDGGETWEVSSSDAQGKDILVFDILDLLLVRTNQEKILYAATQGHGLYKSLDQGSTWSLHSEDKGFLASSSVVNQIDYSRQDPKVLYLTLSERYSRVLKSIDGGENFTEIFTSSDASDRILSLSVDPSDGRVIYLGTQKGSLVRSQDGGKSWQALKWFSGPVTQIAINPYNAHQSYLVANGRLYKSLDYGKTWEEVELRTYKIFPLKILSLAPGPPYHLYIAGQGRVLRSQDQGNTWEELLLPLSSRKVDIRAIALDPQSFKTLYVALDGLIYKSTNFGQSWQIIKLKTKRAIREVIIDPESSQVLYLGLFKPRSQWSIIP